MDRECSAGDRSPLPEDGGGRARRSLEALDKAGEAAPSSQLLGLPVLSGLLQAPRPVATGPLRGSRDLGPKIPVKWHEPGKAWSA